VLGIATGDLLSRDDTMTVRLAPAQDATHLGRASPAISSLGDDMKTRRALPMIRDRYVVLTQGASRDHPLVIGWGAGTCDFAMPPESIDRNTVQQMGRLPL
jgi:hypothetical protein